MALELLSMDLSSTMIACVVSAIVIFISYLIYRFGIGEKSFEEAIEEQKKRAIEEELQQKLEKGKKEKKFKKTWGKKSKEKVDHDNVSEVVQTEEKKDDVPNIEIVEPKEVKSSKQKNKAKANLSLNTANASSESTAVEKSKKSDNAAVIEKSVQEKKAMESPKQMEKVKTEPKITEIVKPTLEIIENVPSSVTSSVQTTSAPVTHKKKKKDQTEKDAVPMTFNQILPLIKETELDTEEIQNLIDVLLNKQKDSTGWTKKNDQLALTKKNLQEKEHFLEQEKRQHQEVTSKLKDLRDEYNLYKTKYSAMEKANQEKISRQQLEIQTFTARVKQVQEQLTAEKEKFALAEKEIESRVANSMKKLEEEKSKLEQKVSKLESESRSGVSKAEFEALKKSREDLQKVHSLLVEQHTQIIASHKNDLKPLHAQLADAKVQVEELNAKNKILSKDIKVLNDNKAAVELSKRTLEDKLLSEEKRSVDLETQIKCLTAKVADFSQLQIQLKDLRLENEKLAEQLVSTKERVAGDGQEVLHQNGEMNGKAQEDIALKSLDEKEKLLKEKEAALTQLTDDLNKQKASIAVLREELEAQKLKNNELREKNWKAMEALKAAENSAELKIKEIQVTADKKLERIQEECAEKISVSKTGPKMTSELENRLREVESNAAQRLSDYNNEVERNKKLTSEINRITNLHQSEASKITEIEVTVEELRSELTKCRSKTMECLLRICPNVLIESTLLYEPWLQEFEKQAVNLITSASSPNAINELLEAKEKEVLENQRHYEKVLGETESTLRKLQEQAESQEVLWQERLNKKQEELAEILSEKEALIADKEAVQSTFQQMSQFEELQEKLKLLQSTLETAENERSYLEQKFEEVNKNCINLRDQLENKEKQLTELQKERNSVDTLKQDIEDLKSKLEKEKKISKDFSSQMIRLNSLVKIGQDALTAEQEMVKKLKSQLETSQLSPANGTAPATISSSVKNSESQPKKSSEKSKKKMDASVNK